MTFELPVEPIAMAELDAHFLPFEEEGETGLSVRRLFLGARWSPAPWATVVGSLDAAAGEHDAMVVDAFVRVRPAGPLAVTLGYGKTPLFASARDTLVEQQPIPELPLVAGAFWPGRDVGAEVHLAGPKLPVEAWLRVGNGSGSPAGNDNPALAGDARLDLVLGRARDGADRAAPLGLRVGGGVHFEEAEDRGGIAGVTPTGFTYWRAPAIAGTVWIAEGHAVGLLGPVTATVEGAAASEVRSKDTDGNPDTPREALDPVASWGVSGEVAWMLTGQHRLPGAWPVDRGVGVEFAARGGRLSLGGGAADVVRGGAVGAELGLRVWHARGLGGALSGGWLRYDTPPLERPDATTTWHLAARATARWL